MTTSVLMLALAATLGLAPEEAAWLGSFPADIQVVARVNGVEAARGDLSAMVGAMGPDLARVVRPVVDRAVEDFSRRFGESAAQSPLLILVRQPKADGEEGPPSIALAVRSDDVAGLRRAIAGKDPMPESRPGGHEAFAGADGRRYYTARGEGFVAFGPDEDLIAAIAGREDKETLDSVITDDLRDQLFSGDVGLFVNLAAVHARLSGEIEQLRQFSRILFEQVGHAVGNAGAAEAAGIVYDRFHGERMDCRALVFRLDFDARGLDVAGATRVKPGSDLEKELADARPGSAEGLARLPIGAAHYRYWAADPDDVAWMERLVIAFVGRSGAPDTPEFKTIHELYRQAGRIELVNATWNDHGFGWIYLPTPENPAKMVEAMAGVLRAMKGNAREGYASDVTMELGAVTYKGFTLNHSEVTFDFARLARDQGGDPASADAMRAFFGGDTMNEWFGTDGKRVLSVIARDWDEAKARIDASLAGDRRIGSTASYRAVRSRLPEVVSTLTLVSARELVRRLPGGDDASNPRPSGDPPQDPALFGISLTATPRGYEFSLVFPGEVGPVVGRVLVPLLEAFRDQANP